MTNLDIALEGSILHVLGDLLVEPVPLLLLIGQFLSHLHPVLVL